MKLRIRYEGDTRPLHIEETCSVRDLTARITDIFPHLATRDIKLSLNGSEEIKSGPDATLKRADIVHGDLVHILCPQAPDPSPQHPQPSPQPQSQETSTNKDTNKKSPKNEGESQKISIEPVAGPSASKESSDSGTMESDGNAMEVGASDAMENDDDAIQDGETTRYLREPMLVCESVEGSKVPHLLEVVYNNAAVSSDKEAMCVLMHVLMAESGFLNSQDDGCMLRLPEGWKVQSSHRLTYIHPSCPGVTFTLLVVTMGTLIILHGRASGEGVAEKCQLQLNPGDYVSTVDQGARETYRNLGRFSRLYKDKIGHALLQLTHQALGSPSSNGLSGLIEEIKFQILSCLDARSLCRMARVCKDLNRTASHPQLWRRLYLTDFGRRTHMDLQQDWYKLYKDKYVLRREMRERHNHPRYVVPSFIHPRQPPAPFFPVYPPGILGGDYDRMPGFPGIPGQLRMPRPPQPRFDPWGPEPDLMAPPGRPFRPPRPRNPFGGGGGFGGFF